MCACAHIRVVSGLWTGQSRNQSMVVQFTRPGNMRTRLRKASPMGLIASTQWRLVLARSMK